MSRQRKQRRRKVKYSTITFKLSLRQKRSLLNYCKARRTTPTKLIKKNIGKYLEFFDSDVPDEYYVTENQIDMFSEDGFYFQEEEIEPTQLTEPVKEDLVLESSNPDGKRESEPGIQESLF